MLNRYYFLDLNCISSCRCYRSRVLGLAESNTNTLLSNKDIYTYTIKIIFYFI